MQVLKMYSVRDSKTEVFNAPFYAKTHGEAERNFSRAVTDPNPNNMLGQFPEHFDLFFIGEFDDASGKVAPANPPTHIANASLFASQKSPGLTPAQ